MPNRKQIFTSSSYNEIFAEIARLESLYYDQFKRKLTVELHFSTEGDKIRPIYGITAYYETNAEQKIELEWLENNISL